MCCNLKLKTLNNRKMTESLRNHWKRHVCSDPCIWTTQQYFFQKSFARSLKNISPIVWYCCNIWCPYKISNILYKTDEKAVLFYQQHPACHVTFPERLLRKNLLTVFLHALLRLMIVYCMKGCVTFYTFFFWSYGFMSPIRYHNNQHVTIHTPSITFQHLPPSSARFSYVTEGALFISAQLSTSVVSTLRKVWVLIWLEKPKHACEHEAHPPRVKKRVPSQFKRFYLCWCKEHGQL